MIKEKQIWFALLLVFFVTSQLIFKGAGAGVGAERAFLIGWFLISLGAGCSWEFGKAIRKERMAATKMSAPIQA